MHQKTIFITITILFLVTYIYTGIRLLKLLPNIFLPRFILIILFIIGFLGIILFFSAGEKMNIALSGILYRFSTSWVIIFLYLLIAVLLIDILRLINLYTHFIDNEKISLIFNQNIITSTFIFSVVTLILVIGNIQYHNKKRQHLYIFTNKIETPIRIVGISDLHIGYTITSKEVSKWVSIINDEKPDIVIIAGDIIDNHTRPILKDSLNKVFNRINAPMGIYACTGNHDLMYAIKDSTDIYKKSGISLLRDSYINLNDITIIGRDDYSNSKRDELKNIIKNIDMSKFTILLDHQPTKLNDAVINGIDFQLSGHTHRGQIFPISLLTDYLFDVSYGYHKIENTHFYVSSGLGIWGGKFRIGTKSEYLVLDLKPSKN